MSALPDHGALDRFLRALRDRGLDPAALDEDALLAHVPGHAADVGEAIAIARALRAEHHRHHGFLRALVAALPGSVSFIDADERLLLINDEGAERLGSTPEALVGRTLRDLLGGDYELVAGPIRRMRAQGAALRESAHLIERAGRAPGYRDFALVPMRGPAGELEGVLSVSFDVTARELEGARFRAHVAELESLDRLKNDFLGMISHELRTPINAIMGFGSILEDEIAGPLNGDQADYVRRILGGAEVLLALIADLLDMTRVQAGKFTVRRTPVDAGGIARDVAASLAPLLAAKGQALELALPEAPGPLLADPQRLAQVLTNLLGNAVKFGPPGDRLRLAVAAEPDAVRFTVEDHGAGIAADELPRLFQPFVRLETGKREGGAGLGLSIVRAIAESHGGSAGVESEPGVRTAFWVRLPRA